jgi:hypothetical protein
MGMLFDQSGVELAINSMFSACTLEFHLWGTRFVSRPET